MEKYSHITVEKKEKAMVEIHGEITHEAIVEFRKKALKEISTTVNIPGFRKGHVPEKIIVERFGEIYILEEAAELGLKEVAPEIIEKNAPDYIGRPEISITKIVPLTPITFKITVATVPDFKLPDYASIAKNEMAVSEEKPDVSDKELDDVILEVRKQRAHQAFHETHNNTADHNHDEKEIEKFMPEFTDEFVKSLGNFENIADFRSKAKENILKEKQHRSIEKKRIKLLEKLISETNIELPHILVENELTRMFAQFEGDISNMGLAIEDYLKHIKKTPDDLKKEWHADAQKRAALNLILEKIAKQEKILADTDAVDIEVQRLLEQHKDADALRVRLYVEHTLTLEKVIQFLEKTKN